MVHHMFEAMVGKKRRETAEYTARVVEERRNTIQEQHRMKTRSSSISKVGCTQEGKNLREKARVGDPPINEGSIACAEKKKVTASEQK